MKRYRHRKLTILEYANYGDSPWGMMIYKDGSVMWMGFNRSAFANLLIRPNGETFKVQEGDSDLANDAVMMTEEDHNRIKKANPNGWGVSTSQLKPGICKIAGVKVRIFKAPDTTNYNHPKFNWEKVSRKGAKNEMTQAEMAQFDGLARAGRIPT